MLTINNSNGISDVFSILGNQRRLLLIGYLSLFECDREIEVRHLARVIKSIEGGIPPRAVDTADYESAYNGLIQTHLPKLDRHGIIEYDERAKSVKVTSGVGKYQLVTAIARWSFAREQLENTSSHAPK